MLIGRQGAEEITADEIAALTGTISYEVLCRIGARVPRVYRAAEFPRDFRRTFLTSPTGQNYSALGSRRTRRSEPAQAIASARDGRMGP